MWLMRYISSDRRNVGARAPRGSPFVKQHELRCAGHNIYISAFLFGGKPLEILRRIEHREIALAYSQAIRGEIEEVLALKFHWPAELIDLACTPFWKIGSCVEPKMRIRACSDPDDDRILECAVEAHAHYIITGDKHLLTMKSFEEIPILTADQYLKL